MLLFLLTILCWIGYCLYFELKFMKDARMTVPLFGFLLFSSWIDELILAVAFVLLIFLVVEAIWREKKLNQVDKEYRFRGWLVAFVLTTLLIAVATENSKYVMIAYMLLGIYLFVADLYPVVVKQEDDASEQNNNKQGTSQSRKKKHKKAKGTNSTKAITLFACALGYYLGKNKQYFSGNIYTAVRSMLIQDFPEASLHDNFSSCLIKTNNLKCFQGAVLLDPSVQKMLMSYFLKLTLLRANMQRTDFEDIALVINKIQVDAALQKQFLEQYKTLEKYKALIILLKYMATVSGFASEKENDVAYAYLNKIEKESGADKLSLSFQKIYSLLSNDLKKAAYQAIDYVSMISHEERMEFIKVMFDVANAEEGIIYAELSFLSVCSFYAGLSEKEFQQLCETYNVEWKEKYCGTCFEGFPYGYSFADKRTSAWKQIENFYDKQQKKQKKFDTSSNADNEYKGDTNSNSSNKQNKYQKRQQYWQDWKEKQQRQNQNQQQRQQQQQQQRRRNSGQISLDEAYSILGVSENVSNDEIKKSYRKMAMKYHPDRLGTGASQREIQRATEKITQINQAYDVICKAKGIK